MDESLKKQVNLLISKLITFDDVKEAYELIGSEFRSRIEYIRIEIEVGDTVLFGAVSGEQLTGILIKKLKRQAHVRVPVSNGIPGASKLWRVPFYLLRKLDENFMEIQSTIYKDKLIEEDEAPSIIDYKRSINIRNIRNDS